MKKTENEELQKIYEIKIKSSTPMLHHGSHSVLNEESKSLKKKGGNALEGDPDEWKKSIYFNKNVGVYLPGLCIEGAIINASSQFKIGSGKKTAKDFVKSGVFCENEFLPFYVDGKTIKTLDDPLIKIDFRMVKNPSSKGSLNGRYRAKFNNWESEFKLNVLSTDYITSDLLKQILEYAGKYIGVGDYRPRFGRFQVVSFKEV